eukprot:TRINITY_DN14430_c0_g1_i1.p1 TRINITY_DN14430_c0_g1~~TRINITY_DN14430_c0_g1_i1.p1  ORF type:complete len:233 (-),score=32.93 TRINITY_DN14430_c0_g1_i1:373-1071(-)
MGSMFAMCTRADRDFCESRDSFVSRDRDFYICRATGFSQCMDGEVLGSFGIPLIQVGGLVDHYQFESDDDEGDHRDLDSFRTKRNRGERLEGLMRDLFKLHDLNGNGLLEEVELVKLNEKVAILHGGIDTDRGAVRRRYSDIFRDSLNPDGKPATYAAFRDYMFRILDGLDPDGPTQAMIMDQLIAEADLALATFPASLKIRAGSLSKLPARAGDGQACRPLPAMPISLGGG